MLLAKAGYLEGAWWSGGRALDPEPRGSGFDPHMGMICCVLEQDALTSLSTG